MRLICTCGHHTSEGAVIALCPTCVQLRTLPPDKLREAPPMIRSDADLARERYQRRLSRRS